MILLHRKGVYAFCQPRTFALLANVVMLFKKHDGTSHYHITELTYTIRRLCRTVYEQRMHAVGLCMHRTS
jgi:hypothetical protein